MIDLSRVATNPTSVIRRVGGIDAYCHPGQEGMPSLAKFAYRWVRKSQGPHGGRSPYRRARELPISAWADGP